MSQNEFRVKESSTAYRVEFFRNGKPYVTFLDGLTRQSAQRQAHALNALWARISTRRPTAAPASVLQETI